MTRTRCDAIRSAVILVCLSLAAGDGGRGTGVAVEADNRTRRSPARPARW